MSVSTILIGASDDWAKGVAGIKYVYTIELADTGKYGFVLPPSYIVPVAEDFFPCLKVSYERVAAMTRPSPPGIDLLPC